MYSGFVVLGTEVQWVCCTRYRCTVGLLYGVQMYSGSVVLGTDVQWVCCTRYRCTVGLLY